MFVDSSRFRRDRRRQWRRTAEADSGGRPRRRTVEAGSLRFLVTSLYLCWQFGYGEMQEMNVWLSHMINHFDQWKNCGLFFPFTCWSFKHSGTFKTILFKTEATLKCTNWRGTWRYTASIFRKGNHVPTQPVSHAMESSNATRLSHVERERRSIGHSCALLLLNKATSFTKKCNR